MNVWIVSPGIKPDTCRLQPWRYITEVAKSLQKLDCSVTLVTNRDGITESNERIDGVEVLRVQSVRPIFGRLHAELERALRSRRPDRLIWHVGLSSFFYFHLNGRKLPPSVALFSSPIYHPRELIRLRLKDVIKEWAIVALHFLGLVVPKWAITRALSNGAIHTIITMSEWTKNRLRAKGLNGERVEVIPPGLDDIWRVGPLKSESNSIRQEMGFREEDFVVGYFGSPLRLRGLAVLIEAFAEAAKSCSTIRMLILSRRQENEASKAEEAMRMLTNSLGINTKVHFIPGHQTVPNLKRYLSAVDIVGLPFEIIPSDMPLGILEAVALGKPVVSTDFGCLREVSRGRDGVMHLTPGNTQVLKSALVMLANNRSFHHHMIHETSQTLTDWPDWKEIGERWKDLLLAIPD